VSSSLLVNLAHLSAQPTGLTTYSQNLFPYLKTLAPTLLSSEPIADFACQPVPSGITSDQGAKGHLKRLLWTQFQLPKIYRRLRSSLLFCPVPEAPLGCKVRSVVMVHDLIPLRFPRRSPLTLYARHYVPHVLRQAQHILCNSRSTAADITRFYKIPASKITPILLAHDAANFRFLNLPTQNYFLYLGRIDPYKNVQRLVAAFAKLPGDYQLWFSGPIDQRYLPALKVQITELGLTDRVKFLGYVPYTELPKVLGQAIALVFPSLWEGFGLPVLEAMACGTPVIASNVSALPEVVGDAGLLIDPFSEGAIAEAMTNLLKDDRLWRQCRSASLARAAQFSWAKTGAETVEVLRQYL